MDKLLHFGLSFLLSAVMTFTFSPAVGVSFTVGVGIGKEVGDYMNYGDQVGSKAFARMALGDLLADGAGVSLGTWFGKALREGIKTPDEKE